VFIRVYPWLVLGELMPRKHDNLFNDIACFPSLMAAAKRAIKGKRSKPGPAAFMANLEKEVLRLERELLEGSYKPGRYKTIEIHDPKHRIVSAAPFRDRVVHHALCAVVEPIFERGFIYDSYANRVGKGSHKAVDRYEKFRDRHNYVLRCDIYRYFPSIDHEILKGDLRRRITCERTLWLLDSIIDGSNPQEPVHIHYPGDDLFAPYARRRGLPIGNLTSQSFANLYLDGLDHFCKEVLRAKGYVRYVDDFALFHDDPAVLAEWRERIALYLEGRRLKLHPRKTFIAPNSEPTTFLGFVLLPGGRRRLPEDNVRRFRNRLRGLRDRWRAGSVSLDEVERRVGSWVAHAENANTWRLRQAIFRGGMFDPTPGPLFRDGLSDPKRKPGRPPVASAFFAAVPGTTNRGTCAPPTATGTPPTTGTTTTDSALPAHP
jgi:retron-type reverse transcriptase